MCPGSLALAHSGISLLQRRLELFQNVLFLSTLESKEPFERVEGERLNGLHRQGARLFTSLMPSHAIGHDEEVAQWIPPWNIPWPALPDKWRVGA